MHLKVALAFPNSLTLLTSLLHIVTYAYLDIHGSSIKILLFSLAMRNSQ